MTTPTLFFICKRDQFCGLMLRSVISLWLLWVGFLGVGALGFASSEPIVAYAAPRVLGAAGLVSFVVLPLLLWRMLMIQRVFRVGKTVESVVKEVVERQGIHRIWYRFEWEGQSHLGRNMVKQDRQFKVVKVGDTMEVAVLPNRPQRSFAWPLFR